MKPTYEELTVQLANAESKCRDLAAENVTLNDKMNRLANWPGIEFYSSAWEFCNLDGNDALEFMCDVQTPATNVFLAEVRAQGVEMFALQQRHIAAEQEQAGDYEFSRHCSISAAEACEFAEELREGKCCEVQS